MLKIKMRILMLCHDPLITSVLLSVPEISLECSVQLGRVRERFVPGIITITTLWTTNIALTQNISPKSLFKVDSQNSFLVQIRQLIPYIDNDKG